jgi:hypothetical protein
LAVAPLKGQARPYGELYGNEAIMTAKNVTIAPELLERAHG